MIDDNEARLEEALALQARLKRQIAEYERELEDVKEKLRTSAPPPPGSLEIKEALSTPTESITKLVQLSEEADELTFARIYVEALIRLKENEEKSLQSEDLKSLTSLYEDISKLDQSLNWENISQSHRQSLKSYIDRQSKQSWNRIQAISDQNLDQALRASKWPSDMNDSDNEVRRFIEDALTDSFRCFQPREYLPEILDPFRLLVDPLKSRFMYHFDSNRPTNRLDKPEWFFQHFIALAERHNSFLLEVVQPVLARELPKHALYAPHEFIRAMLPSILGKIDSVVHAISDEPDLLRHLIEEAKRFDDSLRLDFGFRNRDLSRWSGTSAVVQSDEVFEKWLDSSDRFARQRYHAIIEEDGAFEIQSDPEPSLCDIGPNPSSLKLINLVEALWKNFSPLEDVVHRKRFVDSIQVVLLDSYLEKIKNSTDAFDELAHGFSGGFPMADIAGKAGLQRLCRQLSGVTNVSNKIKDWSNEAFCIELDSPKGSCLQLQLEDYKSLQRRIENLIAQHIFHELSQELRPYTRLRTWSADESPLSSIASSSTSSVELIQFYGLINTFFTYLSSVATPVLLHRLYVEIAPMLDDLLWSQIVARNSFSRRGAMQLQRDVLQIWYAFSPYVSRPEPAMPRLRDTLALLDVVGDETTARTVENAEQATTEGDLRSAGICCLSLPEVRLVLAKKAYRK